MSRYRSSSGQSSLFTCGCYLAIFIFNISVGGWSVNYLLQFFLDKTISFLGAAVIGLFAGELTVPVAVVIAILRFFNVL